jgi:nucleotide-binding universal stress UspA family protein
MKRFLVAVDGSEPSRRALETAVALARPVNGVVSAVYVVPPLVVAGEAPWASLNEVQEAERQRGETTLVDVIARSSGGYAIDSVLQVGNPGEVISALAEAGTYDVVVVGSTGKGAVKRLLIGSTADRLVHLCRCAVLVVR